MSYTINLRGYDTLQFGPELELPTVVEILRNPFIVDGDAEEVYKHGSDLNRWLLSQTPITHTKKYVIITSFVQYLTPQTASIPNIEWHCDPGSPAPFLHDAYVHIMSNPATSLTEFMAGPMDLTVDDHYLSAGHREFRVHLTERATQLGVQAKSSLPNRMVTFTHLHAHRAIPAQKPELRFLWRVQESDVQPPNPDPFKTVSQVLRLSDGKLIPSIEQHDRWIIIRDKIDLY